MVANGALALGEEAITAASIGSVFSGSPMLWVQYVFYITRRQAVVRALARELLHSVIELRRDIPRRNQLSSNAVPAAPAALIGIRDHADQDQVPEAIFRSYP
jgi:hypothetical protein